MTARLVIPSAAFRDSYVEAAQEFPADENTLVFERDHALRDFDDFVHSIDAWARGLKLPEGFVASSTFWLVDDDEYIGSVNIRHELNEWLLRFGGHIGYAIRPTKRRIGYGTTICRLSLDESRKLDLDRVLITCDADNIASRKVIEANGGVFENEVPQPDRAVPKLRYWIDL